ncbi:hypothetical protein KCW65_20760, partial [Mycobacterium tuberculosis]|nr:hypothetical protein [Mycobacterium tuberculosis]
MNLGLREATPDPHQAALGLLRVLEQCEDDGRALVEAVGAGGPDPVAEADLDRPLLARLLRVLGTSEAMVDHLVRHPDSLGILLNRAPYLMISTPQASASALRAIRSRPAAPHWAGLRYTSDAAD